MSNLLILFITVVCWNSVLAEEILISVTDITNPVKCSEEPSIQGYFCQSGEDFLIVQSFGDGYTAFGKLSEKPAESIYYRVEKIEASDGKLLYESNLNNSVKIGVYDTSSNVETSPPLAPLGEKYYGLLTIESILTNPYSQGENKLPQTDAYKNFRSQVLGKIRREIERISVIFHKNEVGITLVNGQKVSCKRKSSREENEIELNYRKFTKSTPLCGIFSCGKDSQGNEQLLFMHHNPEYSFASLLYVGPDGFYNGPKISSIVTKEEPAPLISYDYRSFSNLGFYGNQPPEISQESYVPKNLKKQSQFFHNWNTPNYEIMLRDSGRLCKEDSWKNFNNALKSYQEKLSQAELAQYITIVNDILTGYYLPTDQIPSEACSNNGVFYNPKAFKETAFLSPSLDTRVISKKKARELFNFSKNMSDIAWGYKSDGCYARAHLIARRIEALGIRVDKAWLKGELSLKENGSVINWNFHVAPIVYVQNEEGKVERYVIDPSTFDEPVPVGVWSDKLTNSENRTKITNFPFPKNSSMFNRNSLAFSSSTPYLPNDRTGITEKEKLRMANETMARYLRSNEWYD